MFDNLTRVKTYQSSDASVVSIAGKKGALHGKGYPGQTLDGTTNYGYAEVTADSRAVPVIALLLSQSCPDHPSVLLFALSLTRWNYL